MLVAAATNDHVVNEAHSALVLCWELGCHCQQCVLLADVGHHAEVVSIAQLHAQDAAKKLVSDSYIVFSSLG